MFISFFKTGIRNIIRSRIFSSINIFGLSIAIACGLTILAFISFQYSMDSFHDNYKNIYLVTHIKNEQNNSKEWGTTPFKLCEDVNSTLPFCNLYTRILLNNANVQFNEFSFSERVSFVDTSFLDLFNFPLKVGNIKDFKNGNGVIISSNVSEKFFGQDSPVGEKLVLNFGDISKIFIICGVAESFPKNASFKFDVLLSIDHIDKINKNKPYWESFVNASFIKINNEKNKAKLIDYLNNGFLDKLNTTTKQNNIKKFKLESLQTLSLNSYKISYDISYGFGDIAGRVILILIGIMIIVLACINYINIALVSASRRYREIAIRKVVGSSRISLILQFFIENYIINFISFILGLLIAFYLLIPKFNTMFRVGISIHSISVSHLLLIIVLMPLLTAILSGLYPSIQISSHNPTKLIKGKSKFHNANLIVKSLLILQFVLSYISIGFGIVFINNLNYLKHKDWGYDKENVYYARSNDVSKLKLFKDKIEQETFIDNVALTKGHIGVSYKNYEVTLKGDTYSSVCFEICENYLNTLNIRNEKGESIDHTINLNSNEVYVNEKFCKVFKLERAIGEFISFKGERYIIKGVLKDFHYLDFDYNIQPVILKNVKNQESNFLVIKTKGADKVFSKNYLDVAWKSINHNPLNVVYKQEEVFESYFEFIKGHNILIKFVALVSVFLSCIGLFGLISFQITKNIKDYCIRKVMGAGFFNLLGLIIKKYADVIIYAFVIGIPCFYYSINYIMKNFYSYSSPIQLSAYFIAGFIIIFIFVVSIYSGIFKLRNVNPADILRNE